MRDLNVTVVGGGIAGLSTAARLARDGHHVVVFERAAEMRAGGTGILLQPAGLDVLRGLGVVDAAMAAGSPIERVVARRGERVLTELRYADLSPGLHALGIRRSTLAALLLDAARAAGAVVRFGETVAGVERRETGVDVRVASASGGAGVGAGADASMGVGEPSDLVLLCDGTGSRLRSEVRLASVRPHATGVFTFVGHCPLPDEHALIQRLGAGDAAGLLPIGRDAHGRTLVSFFWNARAVDVDALRARGFDVWLRAIREFCPEASTLFAASRGFESMTWYSTAEVAMPRWHHDRVAVLGDAAHALDPHLGVGATMALLDGASLAQALREHSTVADALASWEAHRRAHLAPYARMSRLWSRLDHWRLATLRRASFRLLSRGSLRMRRRLLRYMSGL